MPPRESTATPRNTRARQKTPLPAVPSAPSFAYGAPGKAELRTQLRTAGRDFGEGFEAARQASTGPESVAEAEDEVEDEPSPPPRVEMETKRDLRSRRAPPAPIEKRATRQTPQPEPRPQPVIEPQSARTDAERTATDLDAAARYQRVNRGEDVEMPEPNRVQVFRRTLPRYLRTMFTAANTGDKGLFQTWLIRFFIFMGVLFLIFNFPLPEKMDEVRNDHVHVFKRILGLSPWNVPPSFLQENWYRFEHEKMFSKMLPDYNVPELQYGINIQFLRRIERAEAKMSSLEERMTVLEDAMATLKEILPSNVVVQLVDGHYEIPEPFWAALQERLVTGSDMAPLWQAFIARSETQIEQFFSDAVDTKLKGAMETHDIVTSAYFTELVNEKFEQLSTQTYNALRSMHDHHLGDIKEIAAGAADEVVKQYPSPQFIHSQLQALANMNELLNNFKTMQEVNWFSVGLGARIDPLHTSPTAKPKIKGWIEGIIRSVSPVQLSAHPPIAALQRWEEATDCWCADVDDQGRSKISIMLPEKIYPTRFVIEHIPVTGTQDIKSAPREFELWAKLDDINDVDEVAKVIEQNNEFNGPCGHSPGPGYACIAANRYDIHGSNWVQGYTLNGLAEHSIRSNKFTLRLVNNYGANYTCLYRIRMMGEKL